MRHPGQLFRSVNLVVPFHEVPSSDWFVSALDIIGRFYRFVPLQRIEEYFLNGARFNASCHITFDDGHASFYRVAYPILKARGIPATLFVSPKVIASGSTYWFQDFAQLQDEAGEPAIKDVVSALFGCPRSQIEPFTAASLLLSMTAGDMRRVLDAVKEAHSIGAWHNGCNMSAADLRDVAASGLITVGGHTMDHPVLGNETPDRALHEIRASIAELSTMIGGPVTSFAYPNGTPDLDFGSREQQFLREAGVHVAFTTNTGFFGRTTDPLAIPRGGCPSLQGEGPARTTARLLLMSGWDRLRAIGRPGQTTQAAERLAIRRMNLFPN